jgi:hypothetical protein
MSDGYQSVTYPLTVNIIANQPPAFTTPLVDQTVAVSQALIYPFPPFSDPEGSAVTVTSVLLVGGIPLPSFITFDQTQITFAPDNAGNTGLYDLQCTLSDGILSAVFTMALNVTLPSNRAPLLVDPLVD